MVNSKVSMRNLVGDTLNAVFETHPEIFVIDSDLAKSTTTNKFAEKHPDRFIETGIAEQNAMSIATGIANEGFTSFYVNFAIFASGTCWTQLRQACYAKANVKVIATHPGMDGGFDGATHQPNEDLAIIRALPNITVLVPSCPDELHDAVELAASTPGPFYIRCSRGEVYDLPEVKPLEIGKATVISDEGDYFAVIFEGTAEAEAFDAYIELKEQGKKGILINAASIKPFDKVLIRSIATRVKKIATVENHSVMGGLGSLVAESICDMERHAPLVMIGVHDTFTESGPIGLVKAKYGLTGHNVVKQLGI